MEKIPELIKILKDFEEDEIAFKIKEDLFKAIDFAIEKTSKDFEKERLAIEHLLRTDATIAKICEEVGIRPTDYPFLYTVAELIERIKEEKDKEIEGLEEVLEIAKEKAYQQGKSEENRKLNDMAMRLNSHENSLIEGREREIRAELLSEIEKILNDMIERETKQLKTTKN